MGKLDRHPLELNNSPKLEQWHPVPLDRNTENDTRSFCCCFQKSRLWVSSQGDIRSNWEMFYNVTGLYSSEMWRLWRQIKLRHCSRSQDAKETWRINEMYYPVWYPGPKKMFVDPHQIWVLKIVMLNSKLTDLAHYIMVM